MAEITSLHNLLSRLGAETQIPEITQSRWFADITEHNHTDTRFQITPDHPVPENKAARIMHLRSRILTARMLNNLFNEGLNKSEVLLLQTGTHIRHIIDSYPDQKIKIFIDKQGGKSYYAPFLMQLLNGEWVDTIHEGASSSLYRFRDNIYLEFTPKADRKEFTVALASIISKFLREILMEDFNRYFSRHIPELKPTAGYPQDARRYIDELTEHLASARIEMHEIWRQR